MRDGTVKDQRKNETPKEKSGYPIRIVSETVSLK
jgi:hypothetical protein